MTEPEPEAEVAAAVVDVRVAPSIVWLIPVVALAIGAFVAWRTYADRGPGISITLASAEGLEAGKTKIKYKDVEVGLVEEVLLAEDFRDVIVTARMAKGVDPYLTEKTRFWVVKPRVAGGQVSGLGTLFSGAYVAMDPVRDAPESRDFRALDVAPIVTTDEPGRSFVLQSYHSGAVAVGTPVLFRKIEVGRVLASELDATGEFVKIDVFVKAPYHERIHQATRFWNASGVDMSVDSQGVRVDTESVVSLLIGGVAFDTVGEPGEPAEEGAVFPLYLNRAATEREIYTQKTSYMLYFEQSVRGLHPGAPVELLGIQIGTVRDVRLEIDPAQQEFRTPVLIEIEPQRIGNLDADATKRRAGIDRLVEGGLRAQLKSGNLLTGALVVALDIHETAEPAQIAWDGPIPVFPTVPAPLEEITQSVQKLAKRLERVPFEQIGNDLRLTLVAAQGALTAAQDTLVSTRELTGPEAPIQQELRRALSELSDAARSLGLAAEQIESQPESVLFGRKGDQ